MIVAEPKHTQTLSIKYTFCVEFITNSLLSYKNRYTQGCYHGVQQKWHRDRYGTGKMA